MFACDLRVLLLHNYDSILHFLCILLISNHMIFLIQFGINEPYGLVQFC